MDQENIRQEQEELEVKSHAVRRKRASTEEVRFWHWLFCLFFRPKIFFEKYAETATTETVIFLVFLSGVWLALPHVGFAYASVYEGPDILRVVDDWWAFWIVSLIGAPFSGVIFFVIGGWLFWLFMRLCGARRGETWLGRRVLLFATVIVASVKILLIFKDAIFYTNVREAFHSYSLSYRIFAITLLHSAQFWSCYVLYRGSCVLFPINRGPVCLVLLILPSLFIIGDYYHESMVACARYPFVSKAKRFSDEFTFCYPRNWLARSAADDSYENEYEEVNVLQDDEGSLKFVIARAAIPAVTSAIEFEMVEEESVSEELTFDLRSCAEPEYDFAIVRFFYKKQPVEVERLLQHAQSRSYSSLSDNWIGDYILDATAPIQKWGAYEGEGYRVRTITDENCYRVTVFAISSEEASILVFELCEEGAYERLRPGFQLVEDTFQLEKPDLVKEENISTEGIDEGESE